MGMTTRVRGRLRSLHTIYKLDPKVRDEKIAETVCLLSVLFLLPYCSRGHAPLLLSLGGWCLASYSCLVLPVLISANYKYPVRWLRKLVSNFPGGLLIFFRLIFRFLSNLCAEISAMEQMFIRLTHIYSFVCQLFFLTLCEVAIISHENHRKHEEKILSGLTTLLFYSVFGYFASRIRDIYVKDGQGQGRMNGLYRHYAKWIFKIAIEWAKAVVIVVCLREQGMKYQPDLLYNIITFTYYLCTEKVLVEIIESAFSYFNFDRLDSLEYLYVPIFLHGYAISASGILTVYLCTTKHAKYALLSSYFMVYLNLKNLFCKYVNPLILEKQMYASFKMATSKDIERWDDICAVCLSKMSKARITPCNHLFHPQCLKRCLKDSYQCPLCKQDFLQ